MSSWRKRVRMSTESRRACASCQLRGDDIRKAGPSSVTSDLEPTKMMFELKATNDGNSTYFENAQEKLTHGSQAGCPD